ncbi:26S proteasome regulatory subunit N6 [Galdieria sulphuraria]|uniref:26S proteasome regulatory subunit N6 n=1 Tax=Galdieria sulphuraria TaxID=130081 RepID=M2Y5A0_GALSU|nr:26S proteasome regulatory subunit N6 [Galdieria sulphuraria]EME31034.1 26S proteasome regulatory subunit N6 [Galdieria sulphuraria]|eukprot:XP_005707554.1 26S proteasome regulatory subunit N6 [Galdieria sulphuraria]
MQLSTLLEQADEKRATNSYQEAERIYLELLNNSERDFSEEQESILKYKEQAALALLDLYVDQQQAEKIVELTRKLRPFFGQVAKAKTAKLIRVVLDRVALIPKTEQIQIDLCLETIEWCRQEKRTFLRQRVQAKLSALYFQTQRYLESLAVLTELLKEVKKLDDKSLLLEIQLLECRVQLALRNIPKARGALTSARTTANAIYVPPGLQGEVDLLAGIVSAEEHDYKTAYSYFYESFEGFSNLGDERAVSSFKYMLLCKIMTKQAEDVAGLISTKFALRYNGKAVDAMLAISRAHQNRSLAQFQQALKDYPEELTNDVVIHSHLSELYDTLLQQNILRIVEPFSRVEITHIAELIGLPMETVESKISQMILDGQLKGTLDQGANCLITFTEDHFPKTYYHSLQTMKEMSHVVDILFENASLLS